MKVSKWCLGVQHTAEVAFRLGHHDKAIRLLRENAERSRVASNDVMHNRPRASAQLAHDSVAMSRLADMYEAKKAGAQSCGARSGSVVAPTAPPVLF